MDNEQTALSDDTLNLHLKEREALANELAQAEASLEADFVKWCAESLTPSDEEKFFDDKEAFIKDILEKQNKFLKDRFEGKVNRLKELDSNIAQEQFMQSMSQAQQQFLNAHPEADINVLIEFYNQDLPPRTKAEIDSLSPLESFEALYAIYKQANNSQQAQAQEPQAQSSDLPQKLQGNPAQEAGGYTQATQMSRF